MPTTSEILTNTPRAMILAAGKGTRLRPLTDTMPKALVPVNGVPLVTLQINKLKAAGFTDITINVHHFADMLCRYIDTHTPEGVKIHISSERERLLNTGGALRKARNFLLGGDYAAPVLIHNVDILGNADLKVLYAHAFLHDATLLVSKRNSVRRLLFDKRNMRLAGWKNLTTGELRTPYDKLDETLCEDFAFSGIHVISPRLLKKMDVYPEEFSIIDFYLQECLSADITAEYVPDLRLLDVGKTDTLEVAAAFEIELETAERDF